MVICCYKGECRLHMKKNSDLQKEKIDFFHKYEPNEITDSYRVLCTPSSTAKEFLWYVQEVGSLKSLKPHTSQRHDLDSYLFMIVISGKGVFSYDGGEYHLIPNDIVFIDCKNKYSHRSSRNNPWELMWVHFNGNLVDNYFQLFYGKRKSVTFNSGSSATFKDFLLQLIEVASNENGISELLSSNILNSLITTALTFNIRDEKKNQNLNSKKTKLIKKYIDNHFKQKISLDLIAKEFFISKYYMSREFKKKYDITINNYIINKRITFAKELLRFTHMPIGEVGNSCGINDSSYFNKIFQKNETMSPSEYRKKWRGTEI